MNSTKKVRNSLVLVLAALIWGVAFVAQSKGGEAAGPYSFNCIRCIIGGIVLIPVIKLLDHLGFASKKPITKEQKRTLLLGGLSCGAALFVAGTLQQLGIYYGSGAGKAGFLTACYILLVPILSLFMKKRCGWNIWAAVMVAMVGLYLLCMNGRFGLQISDILLLSCALVFAVHILIIDRFSPLVDGVRLSCIQFFVSGLLGVIPMLLVEMKHSMEGIRDWAPMKASWEVWIPILYAGIMSCGVAYTLQIIGQNGLNPTVASLILSLESVFSVIAGGILLKESMSGKELVGCVLILSAILLAQIPVGVDRECLNMKKHLAVVLSSVINFILSFFSYFYLYMSIASITGNAKGPAYEIQEPDKSFYELFGGFMLFVYILVGLIIQFVLYKLSKQSKKRYFIHTSIIYIIGIVTGYFFSS